MNAPIRRLFGLVVLLMLALIFKTSWNTVFTAEALRDNPKNARDLLEQERIRRGRIRADDGTLLARSVKSGAETWRRSYTSAAKLFANPLGYAFVDPGRTGLEAAYNGELSGEDNGLRSILDELRGKRVVGDDLITTLDPAAQRLAESLLAGRPGAVVALDPSTGAVKVMAQYPSYDPQDAGDRKAFAALRRRSGAPLLDRATQGLYPPGSTFKVVTAIAALDSGRFTPQSRLSGKTGIPISGVPLDNDDGESYGSIDMDTALTHSVNTYWAQVAEQVGKPTLKRYMERLGFDRPVAVDLPRGERASSGVHTSSGAIRDPTSRYVDIGRVGIGQEKLLVTPLQMAMVASAVANGGVLMRPHMGAKIVDDDGRTVRTIEPEEIGRVMTRRTATEVREMMKHVVKEGTGTAAALEGIDVAGKTGTAQKDPSRNITQPWFIAFAPADHPRIAVAVTIENVKGGYGGTDAAPIAKRVMQELLK
ncbi:MAG TPA: penicillin-binding protein 2 [Solirubrobacteraceae bacterium]|nr:penicillin-binding protein 2 [Solirubrobacteraceae bacterium]